MYSYVEETDEGTVLYQVRTFRWFLCLTYFYASEGFEITGIPYLYRKCRGVSRRPTFLEWLAAHRSLWSKKTVYPKGTRLTCSPCRMSHGEIGYWFSSRI